MNIHNGLLKNESAARIHFVSFYYCFRSGTWYVDARCVRMSNVVLLSFSFGGAANALRISQPTAANWLIHGWVNAPIEEHFMFYRRTKNANCAHPRRQTEGNPIVFVGHQLVCAAFAGKGINQLWNSAKTLLRISVVTSRLRGNN